MPNDVIDHIGICISEARKRKKLPRRKLSDMTGVSEKTIRNIEQGKTNATIETLAILIRALDMPAGYLFRPDIKNENDDGEYIVEILRGCSEKERHFICETVQDMVQRIKELR